MPLTILFLHQIPCISLSNNQTTTASFSNFNTKKLIFSSFAPLALAIALNSPLPLLAIPPPISQTAPLKLPPTTPYSQSKNFQTGLENGKIRPCPSMNPSCVSTNPMSSLFAFPWVISGNGSENAAERLREAILRTQKNAKIQINEETPNGHYLQAEVDGGFGRDVMEFMIKGDVVTYRSMATKVTYIYPFTTALGDSKGQNERMNKIVEELGWSAPSFETMDKSAQFSSEDYLE